MIDDGGRGPDEVFAVRFRTIRIATQSARRLVSARRPFQTGRRGRVPIPHDPLLGTGHVVGSVGSRQEVGLLPRTANAGEE